MSRGHTTLGVLFLLGACGGRVTATGAQHGTGGGTTPICSEGPGGTTGTTSDEFTITEFVLETGNLGLAGITAGSDGNLWFTESIPAKIGRITTTGTITEFPLPGTVGASASDLDIEPYGITAGPDGNVWFVEVFAGKIGRISPTGAITEYSLTRDLGYVSPYVVTVGPDGNLWFTESAVDRIGYLTPAGALTEFQLQVNCTSDANGESHCDMHGLHGISPGPDGNLWFVESNHQKIGRITPTGTITEFPDGKLCGSPHDIVSGPDGNLWFTEPDTNKIGRITPSGSIMEFPVPPPATSPTQITAGPDGNLWFAAGKAIGRITPAGTITEFAVPVSHGGANSIAAGPDGNIWFTDSVGSRIGRVNLSTSASGGTGGSAGVGGASGTGGDFATGGSGVTPTMIEVQVSDSLKPSYGISAGRTAISGSPSISTTVLAASRPRARSRNSQFRP